MKFYTYIIRSEKDSSYYIGSSSSIKQRIGAHNKGKVRSTRYKRPLKLIYTEDYPTLKEAMRRERQLKSWKRRDAIEKLIKNKKQIHGPIV